MKRQIRKCAFETNSSSQHSLVIKKKDEYYTTEEIMDGVWLHDGEWKIWDGFLEFERSPFRCISGFADKFYYMMAALTSYKDDAYNELEAIAKKYIPGLIKIVVPKICRSIAITGMNDDDYSKTEDELIEYLKILEEKYDGFSTDYWTNQDEDYWFFEVPYTGYAEDYGMLKRFLDEKNVSMEEFLTNKKYVIIQDGDEYCYFRDLKNSGLFNIDVVDYEYS